MAAVIANTSIPAAESAATDWSCPLSVIDTESVHGDLDTYCVTWWIDDSSENPFDEYDHVTSLVLRPSDRRLRRYSYGPLADEVARIIQAGTHSEAAVLRWLGLRGCRGIHTLSYLGHDGRIAAAVPFGPDTELHGAVLEGIAFVVPDLLGDVTDPGLAVRTEVEGLSLWSQGDVYGYSVRRGCGELIGSGGGFVGWRDSKDTVLREDIADHIGEHESRLVEQAHRAGAGVLGVI